MLTTQQYCRELYNLYGVNLSIMTKKPHWLSKRPSGTSICAIPSMINSERWFVDIILKVRIKHPKNFRTKHSLINNCLIRQRAEIKLIPPICWVRRPFNQLPADIQFTFNVVNILFFNNFNKYLLDVGHGFFCIKTNYGRIYRNGPPSKHLKALLFKNIYNCYKIITVCNQSNWC